VSHVREDVPPVPDQVPVLVASASPAYAAGLAGFLGEPPLQPYTTSTTDAALCAADAETPALAVIDLRLADGPGVDLAQELRRRHPQVRVLLAVGDDAPEAQLRALAAGACGVVLTTWPRELVAEAAADALRGVTRFDVDLVRALAGAAGRRGGDVQLTEQERVVLRLMRQHLTYKEIAQRLGVSWHTVRTHAQSILRKSGVHSRRELETWDPAPGAPQPAGRRA
jgi:DNA-binding NarL/FixJ family response regulator